MRHTSTIINEVFEKISSNKNLLLDSENIDRKNNPNVALGKKKLLNRILEKVGVQLIKSTDLDFLHSHPFGADISSVIGFTRRLFVQSEEMDKIYHWLEDDDSKKIFDWFIKTRLAEIFLGKKSYEVFPPKISYSSFSKSLREIHDSKQKNNTYKMGKFNIQSIDLLLYPSFILKQYAYKDIIFPKEGDFVIDAGACFGETSFWFSEHIGNSGQIFAFEPEKENLKIIKKNLKNNYSPQINLVEKGLWNAEKKINISSSGASSKINENWGDQMIEVTTLDKFVEENKIPKVDYVKMDIEGAERFALEGMKNTIKNFSPNLAVCVYHLPDDIYVIPEFVKKINPNYKVYLDHFSINNTETVMFFKLKE